MSERQPANQVSNADQGTSRKGASDFPTAQSFEDARSALRAVSLRLKQIHKLVHYHLEKSVEWPYECPLSQNGEFEASFQRTLQQIEALDQRITTAHEDALEPAYQRVRLSLRKAFMKEPHQLPPGPANRALNEAREVEHRRLLAAQGIPDLKKQREGLVDGIYEQHAESYNAILRFLPSVGLRPVSRDEAHDRGILPGEDYLITQSAPISKLQERVATLATAFDEAEQKFLSRTSAAEIPRNAAPGGRTDDSTKHQDWMRLTAAADEYEILVGTLSKLAKAGRVKNRICTIEGRRAVFVLRADVRREADNLANKKENKRPPKSRNTPGGPARLAAKIEKR